MRAQLRIPKIFWREGRTRLDGHGAATEEDTASFEEGRGETETRRDHALLLDLQGIGCIE